MITILQYIRGTAHRAGVGIPGMFCMCNRNHLIRKIGPRFVHGKVVSGEKYVNMQLSEQGVGKDLSNERLRAMTKDRTSAMFPHHLKIGKDKTLKLDWLTDDQIPEIYDIITQTIRRGKSAVSVSEFSSLQQFYNFLSAAHLAVSITYCNENKIIGLMIQAPMGMCRSALPICARGYIIIRHEDKFKNMMRAILSFAWACNAAAGFHGFCGLDPHRYARAITVYTCLLPQSVLLKKEWTDDIVMFNDFAAEFSDHQKAEFQMSEEDVIERALKYPWISYNNKLSCDIQIQITLPGSVHHPGVCIRPAEENENKKVHLMLSSAAKTADGFGVDEIPSFSIFKEKFLLGRTLHVIQDQESSDIIGTAVVGPSHLTRGNPNFAMLYLYLLPRYRGHGYGKLVENVVVDHLETLGYTGVLTDMLLTDTNFYRFASTTGYVSIGSVPRSAYVTKQGWTDAAVLYKCLHKPMVNSWLNDFSKRLSLKAVL